VGKRKPRYVYNPHTYRRYRLISPAVSYFSDIQTEDPGLSAALKTVKAASFIAWDPSFFKIVGPDAKLEVIQTFAEPENGHVHEAPVFLPETNELLYSDTSDDGGLFAVNIDTHKVGFNSRLDQKCNG
jgi:gluconolactonase